MPGRPQRTPVRQAFVPGVLTVGTGATPLTQAAFQANLSSFYTTIMVSVPVGGNPVYMGDGSVSGAVGNGVQIAPGVPVTISLANVRQLYEIQGPLLQNWFCPGESIPIPVWDVSTIYFSVAAGTQAMGFILFPEMFV